MKKCCQAAAPGADVETYFNREVAGGAAAQSEGAGGGLAIVTHRPEGAHQYRLLRSGVLAKRRSLEGFANGGNDDMKDRKLLILLQLPPSILYAAIRIPLDPLRLDLMFFPLPFDKGSIV